MLIKRFADAKPYQAPNHFEMCGLRLQGFEEGGPKTLTVGLSHFLPGGGAGPDSSPFEKVYVVLSGSLSLWVGDQHYTLNALDSCTIAPNEVRKILNETNEVVTMIVAMPYPPS